jgi:hypothetical protein
MNIFYTKFSIYLSLGLHKGLPSHRRNLQPLKENLKTCFLTFSFFVVHFRLHGSGSGFVFPMRIRIRIQPTKINADLMLTSTTHFLTYYAMFKYHTKSKKIMFLVFLLKYVFQRVHENSRRKAGLHSWQTEKN